MNWKHLLIFATIALSMFLDGLDGSIVNVALPSIAEDFGISASDTSWVITVYYLMMAGLILVFGRLCDKGAIKTILIAGMATFVAGSLFCGISTSLALLLVFRAVQGVGAAMLASSAVMLGVKFLPREKLGLAMSLVVLGTSFGVAVGPSMGAVLTELISWHWIFFINVPIGLAAIVIAHVAIPKDEGLKQGDVDLVGSVILFAGITSGLYALERMPSVGITAGGLVALAACLVLMCLFVRYEKGRAATVMDLGLFRNRNYDIACLAYIFVNMGIMGVYYLIPFYIQDALGLTTLECGMILSLQAVSMVACCLVVGRLSDRKGDRPFAIAACAIMTMFMVLGCFFELDTPLWFLVASILLLGSIWGVGGGPMGARMVDALSEKDKGSGSSMITFIMYFSSALGTAVFAGLFSFGAGSSVSISEVSADVFMDGFGFCMIVAVLISLAALVCSWMVKVDRGGSE